jgi:hypothetical protein
MPNRVCFLVDGFNVYHSIIEAMKAAPPPAASMKWLDFLAFCRSFLPSIGRTPCWKRSSTSRPQRISYRTRQHDTRSSLRPFATNQTGPLPA